MARTMQTMLLPPANQRPDPHELCPHQNTGPTRHALGTQVGEGPQGKISCINRIRGLLAEFGVVLPQGPEVLGLHLSVIVEDANNDIAVVARLILSCNEQKITGASWMHTSSLMRCIYPALSANSHQSAKYVVDEIKSRPLITCLQTHL